VTFFTAEEAKVVVELALSFCLGKLAVFSKFVRRSGIVFLLFELVFDPEATTLGQGVVVKFRFPELDTELLLPEFIFLSDCLLDFSSEPFSGLLLLEVAVSGDISVSFPVSGVDGLR
jgi:hypothetical protein